MLLHAMLVSDTGSLSLSLSLSLSPQDMCICLYVCVQSYVGVVARGHMSMRACVRVCSKEDLFPCVCLRVRSQVRNEVTCHT